uniref:Putative secreted protein n=1 Tax=Amblyomma triste TaxID=251400 RepID=A0A023GE11_AMBTT
MSQKFSFVLLLQCVSLPFGFSEPSCQKFEVDTGLYFLCKGFSHASELATGIPRPEHQEHFFSLSDSRLESLPAETFRELTISNLTLSNVHIENFSATHPNAFEGLNGTLKDIFFRAGSTLPASWNVLKDVLSLLTLRLQDQTVSLSRDWGNLPKSIRNIFIFDSRVSGLEEGALAPLEHMEKFGITSSRLGNFSWAVLPNPAPHLDTILLGENELTEIPRGFTSHQFPALRSIRLETNRIATWDADTLEAIRSHQNNPELVVGSIQCRCAIRPLLEFPKGRISGTCYAPENLQGRKIDDLRFQDLQC